MQKQTFKIDGYAVMEKTVAPAGTSGRVFVPLAWAGKSVTIILTGEEAKK
jgi:putative transposon-encoded protein